MAKKTDYVGKKDCLCVSRGRNKLEKKKVAAVHLWPCWRPSSNLIAQLNPLLFCFASNRNYTHTYTHAAQCARGHIDSLETKFCRSSQRDRSALKDTAAGRRMDGETHNSDTKSEPSPFTSGRLPLVAEAVRIFFYCNLQQ